MLLLAVLALGLGAGWLAQLLLGRGSAIDAGTLVAGLLGSLLGGLFASVVSGDGLELRLSGFIGSVAGAVVVLLLWSLLAPGSPTSHRRSS